jgi:hypothetical protein
MTQPTLMQIAADIRLWAADLQRTAITPDRVLADRQLALVMTRWAEGIEYQTKMITEELTALLKEPPK